jgi:5-methylcytosine-specific restriction endonuclease McrA
MEARKRPKLDARKLARIRLAVFARDGFKCLHCGWGPPVPENYKGFQTIEGPRWRDNDPDDNCWLELDHVYPHSLGGPFAVENLQSLCAPCNNRKGAKI